MRIPPLPRYRPIGHHLDKGHVDVAGRGPISVMVKQLVLVEVLQREYGVDLDAQTKQLGPRPMPR